MLPEYLKIIEWRPLLPETIKDQIELFNRADKCHSAVLYKLFDGRVIYYSYWLAPHGIGPDHCSVALNNIEELEVVLESDV